MPGSRSIAARALLVAPLLLLPLACGSSGVDSLFSGGGLSASAGKLNSPAGAFGTASGGATAGGAPAGGATVGSTAGGVIGVVSNGGSAQGGAPPNTAGAPNSSAGSPANEGGTSNVSGAPSSAGSANGGSANAGGGAPSSAGSANAGALNGGAASGGSADGGTSSGGSANAGATNAGASNGGATCSSSARELCDGLDNNCNSEIDEGACPAHCTGFALAGHGYMVCDVAQSEATAAATCDAAGLRLAWIESAEETTSLVDVLSNLAKMGPGAGSNLQQIFIGATDVGQSGHWHWIDGADFWLGGATGMAVGGAYANWSIGRPNSNSLRVEECAVMVVDYPSNGRPGQWNDVPCSETHGVLCEQK